MFRPGPFGETGEGDRSLVGHWAQKGLVRFYSVKEVGPRFSRPSSSICQFLARPRQHE
jgi:hypothetical protein